MTGYSPIIGLEIHVQLRTRSKLFCACSAEYGGEPNTRVCPVCMGSPGTLPVLDAEAVQLAVRAALGLGARVAEISRFARKHYFYPDLPKGYQITQNEHPLAVGGAAGVALRRLHLEEDSGRTVRLSARGETMIDLNRAGIPLVEIVTEPVIASPAKARDFLTGLKRTLEYLEVSDCNMEEGSLRVDANVSLRGGEGPATERTEIKNLNSFSGVERALEHEIQRHREMLARGEHGERETRAWDAAAGVTRPLRGKEAISDYRYLDEPDLAPLRLDAATVQATRAGLPELPAARAARLRHSLGLSEAHAQVLTATVPRADYFEALIAAGAPLELATSWMLGEALAADTPLPPPAWTAELLGLLTTGAVTRAQAREVLSRTAHEARSPAELVAEMGLGRAADSGRLEHWVGQALEENPEEARRYRKGEERLLDFFMGRVMALSRGAADAGAARELLARRLDEPHLPSS
jgi:aspartyl-tRNA(Asn)/glutamyl-tRNA(Gln) amidotransferase subunit B